MRFDNSLADSTLQKVLQSKTFLFILVSTFIPLSSYIIEKVRQNKWSYMGLEFMIDSVKSLEVNEIEDYLSNLD